MRIAHRATNVCDNCNAGGSERKRRRGEKVRRRTSDETDDVAYGRTSAEGSDRAVLGGPRLKVVRENAYACANASQRSAQFILKLERLKGAGADTWPRACRMAEATGLDWTG